MEIVEKTEEEVIEDLKEAIQTAILRISKKVNLSALNYMIKEKKWVQEENAADAELFFTEKIPTVLTKEVLGNICEILGLKEQEHV
ncbi:MAG: hypothetical protein WC860_08610 [Candidatus Margulisiibacteriota bacterium]|jgi:hypothetical protein